MKYAIIIPDGCADEPQEALGGKTPLQAARKPNMDHIAHLGVVGRANNVPANLTPASDVATLSLFGYDPLEVYTGRAPLEAAAMGVRLGPQDWAVRCNLVTVEDGAMRDFTAGHITSEEGRPLIEAVQKALGGPGYDGALEFHPGVSGAGTLLDRPTTPWRATRSMFGLRAACNGVLPPSDSCGSSAQPSGMTMAYFIGCTGKGPGRRQRIAPDSVRTGPAFGNRWPAGPNRRAAPAV